MIKKITKALFGKNSLIATALLLTTGFAPFAQPGSVTGKLTDEKGAAVPNANIVLLKQPGNHLAGGSTSAADGKFSIRITAAGSFLLRVNALGFAEFKTEIFVVGDSTTSKEMGMVLLKTEVKQLQDVSVNSLRPAITQKADRMVVNIEGTAMAAGSTAYSVLAKIPGVFIDQDGNIQLNGRAGVTVMIDGKLTYLSAADLRNMLEGMSAENIKNIEIITNPSAKYDAQGSSGMLNINLKKTTGRGSMAVYTLGTAVTSCRMVSAGAAISTIKMAAGIHSLPLIWPGVSAGGKLPLPGFSTVPRPLISTRLQTAAIK
jgi:hypothetical protein